MFENINHKNIPDIVIEQVTKRIIHGDLRKGDPLPTEKEFENILGVGRSTIREALKSLETLDLIQRSKSGSVIASPGNEKLAKFMQCYIALKEIDNKQLFDLRYILEPKFAEIAATQATLDDVKELEKILSGYKTTNPDDKATINVAFHKCIVSLTKNDLFILVYDMIQPGFYRLQQTTLNTEIALSGTSYQDHADLVEAIKSRDSQKAFEIMKRHIGQLLPFL